MNYIAILLNNLLHFGWIITLLSACLQWALFPETAAIYIGLTTDSKTIFNITVSINDIPAFCVPIIPPIAFVGCFKVYDIGFVKDQVQACANISFSLMAHSFGTINVGCVNINDKRIVMAPTSLITKILPSTPVLDIGFDKIKQTVGIFGKIVNKLTG